MLIDIKKFLLILALYAGNVVENRCIEHYAGAVVAGLCGVANNCSPKNVITEYQVARDCDVFLPANTIIQSLIVASECDVHVPWNTVIQRVRVARDSDIIHRTLYTFGLSHLPPILISLAVQYFVGVGFESPEGRARTVLSSALGYTVGSLCGHGIRSVRTFLASRAGG